MSLELFSFDDMFKPSASADVEHKEFTSREHAGETTTYAVALPAVHDMNRDELLDLIQSHTATIFMQDMMLNTLADVLLKSGVINASDLEKRFQELVQQHSLRKED